MDTDGNTSSSLPSSNSTAFTSLFERNVRGYMRPSMRSRRLDLYLRKQSGLPKDAPRSRRVLFKLLESWPFAAITMCVISANAVLIVLETNLHAACVRGDACEASYEEINHPILFFFAIELLMRLYVFRRKFWLSKTNFLDFFVVVVGLIDVIIQRLPLTASPTLPAVGLLRLFRITRVARLWRLVSFFPELYTMLKGLFNAISAMFWGVIMIFALLAIFAVVTVEAVYPVAYELAQEDVTIAVCASGFSSVEDALLTLYQTTVAGDAWGSCAVPLIRNHDQWWVLIILSAVLACVQLGLVNLVLSTIVESTFADQDADREWALRVEYEREREAVVRILKIMQQIDADGDGIIDYADLEAGYRDIKELRELLKDMEIDQHDMRVMFTMMDADCDGKFPYGDFIESLQKSRAQDVKLQLLFLKLQMSQIKTVCTSRFEYVTPHLKDVTLRSLAQAQKGALSGQRCTPSESPASSTAVRSVAGGVHAEGSKWSRVAASEQGSLEVQLAEMTRLEVQLVEMSEAIASMLERQVGTVASFKERVRMSLSDEVRHLGTRGGLFENPRAPDESTPLSYENRGDGWGYAGGTGGGRGAHRPEQRSEPGPGARGAVERQDLNIGSEPRPGARGAPAALRLNTMTI